MELLEKPVKDQVVADRLTDLAQRYDKAGSAVIQLLNMVGGQADGLLDKLPKGLRDNLGQLVRQTVAVFGAVEHLGNPRRGVPDLAAC